MKLEDVTIGMKIKRVRNGFSGGLNEGDVGTITRLSDGYIYTDNNGGGHSPANVDLAENIVNNSYSIY